MMTIGAFARLAQVSPRMLRHYDEIGLLVPATVDAANGYRGYEIAQLGRLHRLLALRDLGFTLEEIRPLLDDEVAVDELRGMLRLRQSEVAQGSPTNKRGCSGSRRTSERSKGASPCPVSMSP